MSEGPLNPPFLGAQQAPWYQNQQPSRGRGDQVIVDIPRHIDPEWESFARRQAGGPSPAGSPVGAADFGLSDAQVDAVLDRSENTAAPFDPVAYRIAQENAGNPDDRMTAGEITTDADFDVEEPVTTLMDKQRLDFTNWLNVGRAYGEVKVLGHTFQIMTLNSMDEMNVGRYVKDYMNTPAFSRAWTVATMAAGIRSVNNEAIFSALAPTQNESELFDQKVRIVAQGYPYAITPVYDGIQKLDAEFAELAEILGKQYG